MKINRKILIASFVNVTGASEKVATRILKSNGWKTDQAVDAYYAQTGVSPPAKNSEKLAGLFEGYRDPQNDPVDNIGINGILKYFEQLGVNPENVSALVALEITQASGMEEMTKEGFVNGWTMNGNCDTLLKQKQHVASHTKRLQTDPALFKRLYRFTFGFAKEGSQKALSLETAIVYWQVLFTPPGLSIQSAGTNWLDEWVAFLQKKWTKSVNKDMWNMTLEFFMKALADDSLSFWSEDGAWPGVIDEFVAHMKEKRENSEKMEVD